MRFLIFKRSHHPIPVLLATLLMAVGLSSARVQTSVPDEETAWVCPMHPDFTMDKEGKCPRCGMALVHASPFDIRDYRLDFRTVPSVVKRRTAC
jgi:rRNA maturation protein Nop10